MIREGTVFYTGGNFFTESMEESILERSRSCANRNVDPFGDHVNAAVGKSRSTAFRQFSDWMTLGRPAVETPVVDDVVAA